MIHYLKHDEIDPVKWDAVVDAAPQGKPYAKHRWLSCLSPGWEALVKDDYASVMPLPVRSKFGVSYIFQPVTAQQLGVFSSVAIKSCVHDFLPFLPNKFRLMQFAVHGDCVCFSCKQHATVQIRHNQLIDLHGDQNQITEKYHGNIKRNIHRARSHGFMVRENVHSSDDMLQQIYTSEKNRQFGFINHQRLYALNHLPGTCKVETFSAFANDDNVHAGLLVFIACGRIFFLSYSDACARKSGACFLLIDHVIRKYSGSDHILDFLGSDLPGVSYRNAGFGAVSEQYYFLSINRLSKPLSGMVNLLHSFRHHPNRQIISA